jgi:hypothetical protein
VAGKPTDNPLPDALLPTAAIGYRGNGDEVEGKRPIYPDRTVQDNSLEMGVLFLSPVMLILFMTYLKHVLL